MNLLATCRVYLFFIHLAELEIFTMVFAFA